MTGLIRLADDVRMRAVGEDAFAERAGAVVLHFPGDAMRLRSVAVLLRTPRSESWLREELARLHPERAAADDIVSRLINERICIRWELGDRLADLHQRTTRSSDWPSASPELEMNRILRESAVEPKVELPRPAPLEMRLAEALTIRRSVRDFNAVAMSLPDIGTLIGSAIRPERPRDDRPPLPLVWGAPAAERAYPSGGALYPIEMLVYPLNVQLLEPGFYYYQTLSHCLVPFARTQPLDSLIELLSHHPVERSGILILLFMDFARLSLGKYGEKAYRLALLEAGHIAQNYALVAAAMGCGTLPICGFDDAALSRAAGLHFPHEAVLYVLAIGYPGEEVA
jgi:SagB-type dehydrogenase family enzyme